MWCQRQALAPCAKLQGLGCGVCEVCVMGVTGDMRGGVCADPCSVWVELCVSVRAQPMGCLLLWPSAGLWPALGDVLGLCPPPSSFTQGPLRPGHSSRPVSLGRRGPARSHRSGRPGCPRRRRWTLPSTSGGHDPVSAARGRDRCFLPGQARDQGAVCKGWVGGRPGRRGDPE